MVPTADGPPTSAAATGPRVAGPLMGRDVEHVGFVPEQRLGPVAVVDVPVDDQHPLTRGHQRSGGDCDVVDQAEAHRPVDQRMMAGRPGHDERHSRLALGQCLDGHQTGTRRQAGRLPRLRCGVGVCIQGSAPGGAEPLQLGEVVGRMDAEELGHVRGLGRQHQPVAVEVQIVHTGHRRPDAGRPLGMALPMMPIAFHWSDHDQHRHRVCPSHRSGSNRSGPVQGGRLV